MREMFSAAVVMLACLCASSSPLAAPLNASTCLSADEVKRLSTEAQQGDIYAERKLFVYYASCVDDPKNALRYAQMRAINGTAQDVASYATVISDPKQAFDWYLKAARMGDSRAKLHVADAYRDGVGTSKDLDQALVWFQLGATCQEFGLNDMEELADFLTKYKPVPLHDVKALAWLDVVADQNRLTADGKESRDKLLSSQSPGKVAMAAQLATEFSAYSGCNHYPKEPL